MSVNISPKTIKKFKAKIKQIGQQLDRALDPRGTTAYDRDKKKEQDRLERVEKAKKKLKANQNK